MPDLNFTNNTNFQSLEVVDRGSETQLQVGENLNFLTLRAKIHLPIACSVMRHIVTCLLY